MTKNWSVTQRHIYQRAYSGMIKSNIVGQRTWFLTLTSNPVTMDGLDNWDDKFYVLQNSWDRLRMRIIKKYGRFDYLNVRVAEAYGVIHVLYRGVKIPDSWLRNAWNELHGSHIIDNRPTRKGDRGASQYLASQYFGGQCGKLIYGFSKNWIYQGSTRDYEKMKRVCKDYANAYVNRYGVVCARIDHEMLYDNWKEWLLSKFGG